MEKLGINEKHSENVGCLWNCRKSMGLEWGAGLGGRMWILGFAL